MGYRSDVAYKIWFDDVALRDTFIDLVLSSNSEWMIKALKDCEVGEDYGGVGGEPRGVVSFLAEDVKWYDGFDDVEGHMSLIRYAEQTFEDSCGARMARMGESEDDIEYDNFGNTELIDYDDVYVARELVTGSLDNAMTFAEWASKPRVEVGAEQST
jgi:hypothetical protein